MSKLINQTDLRFSDISSEKERVYRFPNQEYVTIKSPMKLHVSNSGGHRIFDADGASHYVPSGWIHLCWTVKGGQPNFVA